MVDIKVEVKTETLVGKRKRPSKVIIFIYFLILKPILAFKDLQIIWFTSAMKIIL